MSHVTGKVLKGAGVSPPALFLPDSLPFSKTHVLRVLEVTSTVHLEYPIKFGKAYFPCICLFKVKTFNKLMLENVSRILWSTQCLANKIPHAYIFRKILETETF